MYPTIQFAEATDFGANAGARIQTDTKNVRMYIDASDKKLKFINPSDGAVWVASANTQTGVITFAAE